MDSDGDCDKLEKTPPCRRGTVCLALSPWGCAEASLVQPGLPFCQRDNRGFSLMENLLSFKCWKAPAVNLWSLVSKISGTGTFGFSNGVFPRCGTERAGWGMRPWQFAALPLEYGWREIILTKGTQQEWQCVFQSWGPCANLLPGIDYWVMKHQVERGGCAIPSTMAPETGMRPFIWKQSVFP